MARSLAQWRAQGGAMALEEAVALAQEGATAVAFQSVELAATSPRERWRWSCCGGFVR